MCKRKNLLDKNDREIAVGSFQHSFAKLRSPLVALDGLKTTLGNCQELLDMAKSTFPAIFSQICDRSIFVKYFRSKLLKENLTNSTRIRNWTKITMKNIKSKLIQTYIKKIAIANLFKMRFNICTFKKEECYWSSIYRDPDFGFSSNMEPQDGWSRCQE